MDSGLRESLLTNPSEIVARLFKSEKGAILELTSYQNDELKRLLSSLLERKPAKFVFVQSTRSGKSELISVFIALALLIRPDLKVANISYTQDQSAIIFERVKAHLVFDSEWVRQHVNIGQSMINRREFSKTRLFMLEGGQFRTFSTGKGETEFTAESMLGFGADCVVCDEASSINDMVYRTKIVRMLMDARAPKFLLLSGTPHRKNFMFQAWNNPEYEKFHVDWKMAVAAGQMNEDEVMKAKAEMSDFEFGVWYEARFQDDDEDQLIKSEWIRLAKRDWAPTGTIARRTLGVDVARHGKDLTVLTMVDWYADSALVEETWFRSKISTMETVGLIRQICEEYAPVDAIIVDDDGVGGGVVDRLKELSEYKSKTYPFLNGSSPHKKDDKFRDLTRSEELENSRFLNKRSLYFSRLARLFEKGAIVIPKDEKLSHQLSSIRVRLDSDKKLQILDEKDTGKSPDFADSLMMACSDLGFSKLSWSFA